jgi:hypothetical protein
VSAAVGNAYLRPETEPDLQSLAACRSRASGQCGGGSTGVRLSRACAVLQAGSLAGADSPRQIRAGEPHSAVTTGAR